MRKPLKSFTVHAKLVGLLLSGLLLALQPHLVFADYYNTIGNYFYDKDAALNECGAAAGGGVGVGIGAGGTTVPKEFNLGSDPKTRRINLIKALMADYGLTAAQAAGPVGNFMRESSGTEIEANKIPPNVNQGSTTPAPPNGSSLGYSWAQWSGPRKTDIRNFLRDHPEYVDANGAATDAGAYAFLKKELAAGYKSTITELKKQTTPEAAAESFEGTYESAGKPALADRQKFARQAFDEYNGGGATTTTPTTDGAGGGCASSGAAAGGAAIVGATAFPLKTTRAVMDKKNPGLFKNNTTGKSGHPYTAYDILAPSGTPILAFMEGTFVHKGTDKCGGDLISIYNEKSDMVVSYLHTVIGSGMVEGKTKVAVGQQIGVVGSAADGCGVEHLHIDAAKGKTRPGCKRESCPAANAAKFLDIGPQLYATYLKLP